jgi:hypothetical protein
VATVAVLIAFLAVVAAVLVALAQLDKQRRLFLLRVVLVALELHLVFQVHQ